MKVFQNGFFVVLILLLMNVTAHGQLLTEQFNYTASVTDGLLKQSGGNWVKINTGDSILVESGSLNYTGLPSSVGNKIKFDGAGVDAYRLFTSQSSGTVYYSFILNVTNLGSLNTTGGYCTGLASSTSNFGPTVWTRTNGVNYEIGINGRTTANSTVWSSAATYIVNTNYLIIVSYEFVAGTGNDIARIWINPSASDFGAATAPAATYTMTNTGGTDMTLVDRVLLRQDASTATPFVTMDEMRVGTTWANVVPVGEPATNASNVIFSSITMSGMNINWTNGDGTSRNVLAKSGSAVDSNPVDGTSYSANTAFGSGSQIGTGNYVVYSGTGSSTAISGLSPSTTYHVAVYEFNGAGVTSNYLVTTPGVGNQTTSTPPTPTIVTTGTLTSFGNVLVGSSSSSQSFSVSGTNLTADLTITPPSGFEIRKNANPFSTSVITLTPSGGTVSTTPIDVRFTPLSAGVVSGNISNTSTGAATQNIAASGTGILPAVILFTLKQKNITYGSVVVHSSKKDSVVVFNNGTGLLKIDSLKISNTKFKGIPDSGTIAVGDSAKYYFTFTPSNIGTETGIVVFYHNAPSVKDTLTLSGTGIQAAFFVSKKAVAFGSAVLTQSKKDSVVVFNNGTGLLKIDSLKITNAKFKGTPDSGTIAVGDSAKYYFTFTPSSSGTETGTVVFYHNAPSVKDTLTLSGTGIQAAFFVSKKAVAFGSAVLTQSKKESVIVTNTGSSLLVISSAASNNTDFTITPASITIDTNSSQQFFITFSPSAAGARSGNIIFNHTVSLKDSVTVSGQGISIISIKDARSAVNGTEVAVEGIVTRVKGSYTYMQDDSAGITIFQTSGLYRDSVASGSINKGDKIRIHGKTSEFNFLKEIAEVDIMDFSILSHNNILPVPKILTVQQIELNGEAYEAQLIRVPSISILSPDSVFTAAKSYTITNSTDTTKTVVLRTPNAADGDVDGLVILKKLITFTGVLGQFNSSNPAEGYQLMAIDSTDITDNVLSVRNRMDALPTQYQLEQNFPNPFNPSTTISYTVGTSDKTFQNNGNGFSSVATFVSLKVYDMLGREIATLVNEMKEAGYYSVQFSAAQVSSGLYVYSLRAGNFFETKKMLLLR